MYVCVVELWAVLPTSVTLRIPLDAENRRGRRTYVIVTWSVPLTLLQNRKLAACRRYFASM